MFSRYLAYISPEISNLKYRQAEIRLFDAEFKAVQYGIEVYEYGVPFDSKKYLNEPYDEKNIEQLEATYL